MKVIVGPSPPRVNVRDLERHLKTTVIRVLTFVKMSFSLPRSLLFFFSLSLFFFLSSFFSPNIEQMYQRVDSLCIPERFKIVIQKKEVLSEVQEMPRRNRGIWDGFIV